MQSSFELFPVQWEARDTEGDKVKFSVTCFGRDGDGRSVALHIDVPVYFLLYVPGHDEADYRLLLASAAQRYGAIFAQSTVVRRKSAWGFTNGRQLTMAQLVFGSRQAAQRARRALERAIDGAQTFEAQVDPLLRLFHMRNLPAADWISVCATRVPVPERARGVDSEYTCSFLQVAPCDSPPSAPPRLTIASWVSVSILCCLLAGSRVSLQDIEAYSATGAFPSGDNPADKVIQIAVSLQTYGSEEPARQTVLCLGDTELPAEHASSGVQVVCFEEEADVINAFFQMLDDERVDVLIGYNTFQFDWRYLLGRADVLVDDNTAEPLVEAWRLGRLVGEGGGDADEFELNSGAFGDNKFTCLKTQGVLQIDLLQYFRRETKHESYSLNNMAKFYLNDSKLDVPAWQIFAKWASGDPLQRGEVAAYAAQDTLLPIRLLQKLCVLENMREMANATSVPMSYLARKGQQIKVFSQLLKKARSLGFVFPDGAGIGLAPGTKYEGATVLEPVKGAHFDIVSGLDFASRESRTLQVLPTPSKRVFCCSAPLSGSQCTPRSYARTRSTTAPWCSTSATITCPAWSTTRSKPARGRSASPRGSRPSCLRSWRTSLRSARRPRRTWLLPRRGGIRSRTTCSTPSSSLSR